MTVTPFPRPINWDNLRADEAERVIREWAEDSGRVIFGQHARERIDERGITANNAVQILRHGNAGTPSLDKETDNWKVVVTMPMEGTRRAGVVTAILRKEKNLFVITVEWMD